MDPIQRIPFAVSSIATSCACADHSGVVMDIASVHGIRSTDPHISEVLPSPEVVDVLCAHFAVQLLYNRLAALCPRHAVQPRHRLTFFVKIALPLLEHLVGYTLRFLAASHSWTILCITTPFHAESKATGDSSVPLKRSNVV